MLVKIIQTAKNYFRSNHNQSLQVISISKMIRLSNGKRCMFPSSFRSECWLIVYLCGWCVFIHVSCTMCAFKTNLDGGRKDAVIVLL